MKNNNITLTEAELKQVIETTVKDTLTNMGIQTADPVEMQKDFVHLREWREATSAVRKKGIVTAFGFVVVSVLGLCLKVFLGD